MFYKHTDVQIRAIGKIKYLNEVNLNCQKSSLFVASLNTYTRVLVTNCAQPVLKATNPILLDPSAAYSYCGTDLVIEVSLLGWVSVGGVVERSRVCHARHVLHHQAQPHGQASVAAQLNG